MIRVEYAHDGYVVDVDVVPTIDDPRSHYGTPVLAVTVHRSRGQADNVSPLVGDILDGATVHAIGAVVLSDDDCVAVRRMLGLPPDDPHVVPTYDEVRSAGGTAHGGGCSYHRPDPKWGPAHSSEQLRWFLHPLEGVIAHLGGISYAHNMAALRALTADDVSVGCWLDTPDDARQTIIAAGWPIPFATQAEHRAAQAKTDRRIEARIAAARVEREGGQLLDQATPSEATPAIADGHLHATIKGQSVVPIRIKSEGFGATSDMTSDDVESILRKQGAEIHYIAPAVSGGGYVGSLAGPLEEICYTLSGVRWYLYVVTTNSIDDWCQEWWVSQRRLTAHAAADAIEECRRRAYRATPEVAHD